MKNKEFNLIVKFLVSLIFLGAVHVPFVQEFDQIVMQMLLFQSLLMTVFISLIETTHSQFVRVARIKLSVSPKPSKISRMAGATTTSNRML